VLTTGVVCHGSHAISSLFQHVLQIMQDLGAFLQSNIECESTSGAGNKVW